MGLAKHHDTSTSRRKNATSTKHGTTRYEPPEAENLIRVVATARLYDPIPGDKKREQQPYYVMPPEGDGLTGEAGTRAKVHSLATERILTLEKICAGKSAALGDLLDIVKTKLIVVELPSNSGSSRGGIGAAAVPDGSGDAAAVTSAAEPPGRATGNNGKPCRASVEPRPRLFPSAWLVYSSTATLTRYYFYTEQ
ncbi:hypothetical protein B0H63DRAFT_516115 [Podospora didyma]|uniref:Uncharacterized protein n=1 Tax=Podospora didyma TaxID=330526 RepID=A0AAE0P466_9PEZI|nr:hypothetical protein B0H63DRAFT_516115 [Podospora didyma]